MSDDRIRELEQKLKQLDADRGRIVDELLFLQTARINQPTPIVGSQVSDSTPDTSENKIQLFL
jgi:hypothetical protein